MARAPRPKAPARSLRSVRAPKPTPVGTPKSLGIVPVDSSRLRSTANRKLQQLRQQHHELQEQITHYREVETRAYDRWICQNFGPVRSRLIEVAEKIRYNSVIIDRVDFLGFAFALHPGEAYQRVLDEIAGITSADPSTEPGNEEDSRKEGDPKKNRDVFDELVEELFGGAGDDDDGDPVPASPAPHLDSRRHEIRQVYRAIVKRLHPDSSGPMTQEQKSAWHTAQAAYQSGNLEHLQSILAQLGGGDHGPVLEPTLDSILQQQRELRREIRELRSELGELSTEPAWGFLKKKDGLLQRGITGKMLEKELRAAEAELSELELDLEELKEAHAAWKLAREHRRKPTRRAPRKPRRPS